MKIRINGIEFASPPIFSPVPKPMYSGILTNGNGVTISNYIGDKMSFNLNWDFMPVSVLDSLTAAILSQPIVFEYMEGGSYISFETKRTAGISKTELQYNSTENRYEWSNISLRLEEL